MVLASRSPRRQKLLDENGFTFESYQSGVDDSQLSPACGVRPEEWVAAMAHLKAMAGLEHVRGDTSARDEESLRRVILGADTICVHEGEIYAAPADASQAEEMLRALLHATHEVLTGVSLIDEEGSEREIFVARARVEMGELSEVKIRAHIDSGAWAGKAGGYNLDEALEAGWPIRYEGEASTIMGLPIQALRTRLNAMRHRHGRRPRPDTVGCG